VYSALARFVRAGDGPLYARLQTQPFYMEALLRRSSGNGYSTTGPMNTAPVAAAVSFDEPVAAALLQVDRRRDDDAAYLGLLRCVNDEETLARFLGQAFEHVAGQGCGLLLGPTGMIPGFQPGALVSHYNRLPPWHTPYNPPYAGDLFGSLMEPWLETVLYEFDVASGAPADLSPLPAGAEVTPLAIERLAGDLLPLLVESTRLDRAFPDWDRLEAQTLLDWLQIQAPPQAWLATIEGTAAGFIMLQPDLAPLLQRTGGGRRWLARGYLALRRNATAAAGRLLLGAVTPERRGQGIGRLLWRHALAAAQRLGWRTLTCGPVCVDSDAAAFLTRQGARPQQRYIVYSWSPW
jgi:GNAT superfamily N-acetyltransferase